MSYRCVGVASGDIKPWHVISLCGCSFRWHQALTCHLVIFLGRKHLLRLWSPGAAGNQQTYVKQEAAITVFQLLMMSGVSLETCWAIKKHLNNKFYYTVTFRWLFLYDLYLHVYTSYVSFLCTAALGLLCDLSWTFQISPPGVSTRITTREHPAAEGETVGEKCPGILPKCRLPRHI